MVLNGCSTAKIATVVREYEGVTGNNRWRDVRDPIEPRHGDPIIVGRVRISMAMNSPACTDGIWSRLMEAIHWRVIVPYSSIS